jgi:hypothetical protein
MSGPNDLQEVNAIEAALAALTPLPGRIDRDQLMFRAGQAAAPRRHWFWPSATAALAVVSASLVAAWCLWPAPQTVEQMVSRRVVQPPPAPPRATLPAELQPTEAVVSTPADYASPRGPLTLQDQVLRWGLDGLPDLPPVPPVHEQPLTVDSLLGTTPKPSNKAYFFNLEHWFNGGDQS